MITLGYFAEKKAKDTFCLDDVQPVLCNDGELGHERLDPLLRGVGQQTQHLGRRRLESALAADARGALVQLPRLQERLVLHTPDHGANVVRGAENTLQTVRCKMTKKEYNGGVKWDLLYLKMYAETIQVQDILGLPIVNMDFLNTFIVFKVDRVFQTLLNPNLFFQASNKF